ncbi:hypothetical protein LB452_00620 [Psychroflexus sp. CAK8W]|uniref:Response regulatory domain-containing protein n=1 Tax=Psychroflexus longus TaxID=2873596 RepID=A0ABS7XHN3_9FLAO|nr:hypothetical protein [Psychroflexus longus]MBZ9777411.1 hypothetical protein [Psychroflexus longus]
MEVCFILIDDSSYVLSKTKHQIISYNPNIIIKTYECPPEFFEDDFLVQNKPHFIILCDYDMPIMNGLKVHNRLKDFPSQITELISFFLFTSYTESTLSLEEFDSHFFKGLIQKPLTRSSFDKCIALAKKITTIRPTRLFVLILIQTNHYVIIYNLKQTEYDIRLIVIEFNINI